MNEEQVSGFFYKERHALTLHSARAVLSLVWDIFGPQSSILDVGCGVGTWLLVGEQLGASAIQGIEGPWLEGVKDVVVVVPRDRIRITDLEQDWQAPGKFGLAISLEVAEHLSPQAGLRLVERLSAASPLVLFSAAVPGQGGNGHVNEQWPMYWQKMFAGRGYRAIDCIRPVIWEDSRIPWWYRQNTVLFADKEVAREYYLKRASIANADIPLLGLIHPEVRPAQSGRQRAHPNTIINALRKLRAMLR